MPKEYCVYMMASLNNRALYTGMTNDLAKRVFEHQYHLVEGFSKKYNCVKLVYFESGGDRDGALWREKKIKRWRREKKDNLVSEDNPEWRDLSSALL